MHEILRATLFRPFVANSLVTEIPHDFKRPNGENQFQDYNLAINKVQEFLFISIRLWETILGLVWSFCTRQNLNCL